MIETYDIIVKIRVNVASNEELLKLQNKFTNTIVDLIPTTDGMDTVSSKVQEIAEVNITVGSCEECGYDYTKDNLKGDANTGATTCPKCHKNSYNWD